VLSIVFARPSLFPIIPLISVLVFSAVAGRITSVRIVAPLLAIYLIFPVTISSDLLNVVSAKITWEGAMLHDAPWAIEMRGSVPVSLAKDVVTVVVVEEIVG
jgi:hypothetical protein